MKHLDFPLFKTKIENSPKFDSSPLAKSEEFDLTDVQQRQNYFELKCGPEIKKLKEYLKTNTFVAYLLGKKSSGKGTYAKMLAEVVAQDRIAHFSIGDMVRSFDDVIRDGSKKKDLVAFLEKNYRGFMPLCDIIKALEERSTKILLPTELILALAKREIDKIGRKAIFVDGFPRDLDQVSYSLFFRDLINYRDDLDIFVLIDVPEAVIDQRIKHRVVCPLCQTSRNLNLLPTKKAGYDEKKREFYLLCDNSACKGAKMVTKEGDELGIEPIRERLNKDEILIKQISSLHGIPKIFLRNSVPVDKAKEYVDDYEITPEYHYNFNEKEKKIEITEKPWQILDDEAIASNSLMPPPVVVSLIKQLVKVLDL